MKLAAVALATATVRTHIYVCAMRTYHRQVDYYCGSLQIQHAPGQSTRQQVVRGGLSVCLCADREGSACIQESNGLTCHRILHEFVRLCTRVNMLRAGVCLHGLAKAEQEFDETTI